MRAYWILPNRGQQDDLSASDGERTMPLRAVLDPKRRPPGFSHGVPAELLERWAPRPVADILFAQRFPDWERGEDLVLVSTPAGVDASGRLVHLGLLFILGAHESPRFDLPLEALSDEDRSYARALVHRMTSPDAGDAWAQSVHAMIALPRGRGRATNVELQRSSVRFPALYRLGLDGLTRKPAIGTMSRRAAVLVVVVVAMLGIWLSERSCEQASQSPVHSGGTRGVSATGE